jgi:hypothetical protein
MNEQGMVAQGTNGKVGYKGRTLLLMFLGGALAGAAAAYLAQAENRSRVRAFAIRARQSASHLPLAVREASHAAKEAFVESYGNHGEAVAEIDAKQAKKLQKTP